MKKIYLIIAAACIFIGACTTKDTAEIDTPTESVIEQEEFQVDEDAKTILPSTKKETVYIDADANGNPIETSVEVTLEGIKGEDYILDASSLKDILNREGEEEYTFLNEKLIWQNNQTDIQYQGKSEEVAPVSVKVTYYLDDKEISPDSLKGQSGRVKIRFDYQNSLMKKIVINENESEVHIPFTMISMVMLPKEVFTNIETTNGRIMELDGRSVFVGMGIPGLNDDLAINNLSLKKDFSIPDYAEVEMDANSFELDFTATICSPGIFEDLEASDLSDMISDLENIKTSEEDLGKLEDGVNQFYDGQVAFRDGLSTYLNGVGSLGDGINKLNSGVETLSASSPAIRDGASNLHGAISQIKLALENVDLSQMENFDVEAFKVFINSIQEDMNGISSEAQNVINITKEMSDFIKEATDYQTLVTTSVDEAKTSLSAIDINALALSVNAEARNQAKTNVNNVLSTSSLSEEEKEQILSSLDNIDVSTSLSDISTSIESVKTTLDQIGTLNIVDISYELSEMDALSQSLLTKLSTLAQMLESIKPSKEMIDSLNQLKSTITVLEENAKKFQEGVQSYTSGLDSLKTGTAQLNEASNTLRNGNTSLLTGEQELINGAYELRDGILSMSKEMKDQIAEVGVSTLIDSLKRIEAIKGIEEDYNNFSGIPEGVKGEVRFIIETEAVK